MTTPDLINGRAPVAPFRLKEFLNGPAAGRATASLSSSFAELWSMRALAELDPGLLGRLEDFNCAYPGANGGLALREAIARLLQLDADDVIVTNGSDEAIELVYKGLVDGGDRVSLVEPAYEPLRNLAAQRGARVFGVPLDEAPAWRLSPAGWDRLLVDGTRMVLLNTPHNPTGWMPGDAELQEFLLRARRANVLVVFDEIYAGLDHQQPGAIRCLAALHPDTITVGGLSKAFGLPGLRIGWVASQNRPLIERLRTLRMHGDSFVSGLSEIAALSALKNATQLLSRNAQLASANRQQLVAFAGRRPDLWALDVPAVGVVAFARWLGQGTTAELSTRVLEELQMLVVPSPLFDYGDRHVRFGFGAAAFGKNLAAFEKFLTAD